MSEPRYQPTYREVIGQNVREGRLARNMTQALLGAEVEKFLGDGWPKQVVSAIEQGNRAVDADELVALALALGVRVPQLMRPQWRDNDPNAKDSLNIQVGGKRPIQSWILLATVEVPTSAEMIRAVDRLIRDATRFRDRAKRVMETTKGAAR